MTRAFAKTFLALCLLATLAHLAHGEAPSGRLTINDVFNLQLATDPQISPDGKRIIYVRQFSDIMGDRRHSNLWIIDLDRRDGSPRGERLFALCWCSHAFLPAATSIVVACSCSGASPGIGPPEAPGMWAGAPWRVPGPPWSAC